MRIIEPKAEVIYADKESDVYRFQIDTQIKTFIELCGIYQNVIEPITSKFISDHTICRPCWLNGFNIYEDIYGKISCINGNGSPAKPEIVSIVQNYKSCFRMYDSLLYLGGLSVKEVVGVLSLDTAIRFTMSHSSPVWHTIVEREDLSVDAKIITEQIRRVITCDNNG